MTRIFVETDLAGRDAVHITGETAHYLLSVLRSRRGNRFVCVDPSGRECEAIVESCLGGEVRARIMLVREPAAEPQSSLVLYQALLKNRNFELVLQKCTELGVTRFVPIVTERTVPRPVEDRIEERAERWDKIIGEACRQCGRNRPPTVSEPLDWLAGLQECQESGATGFVPYEELAGNGHHALRRHLTDIKPGSRVALFVGPEGGLSASEVEQARGAGLVPVSLGPRILRAETAAIAACAVLMYELGDW